MTERVKHIFEEENDMKKTGKILALTLASLMALISATTAWATTAPSPPQAVYRTVC